MNIRQGSILAGVSIISVVATYFVSHVVMKSSVDTTKAKVKEPVAIHYDVKTTDPRALEIKSNSNIYPCSRSNNSGCFKIKRPKTGVITFTFDNAEPAWELKQFTICQGGTPIKNSCIKDLTLNEQLEFFVMDDSTGTTILLTPKSGEVDLVPLGDALRTFYLFDQNTIKQDFYYSIKACNKDTDECLNLDPPIENKGRD